MATILRSRFFVVLASVVTAMLVGGIAFAAPAAAAPPLGGAFIGTSTVTGPAECGDYNQHFLFVGSVRHETLTVDACTVNRGVCGWDVAGTFTIQEPPGTLAGTVTGGGTFCGVDAGFDFTLTPTNGTRGLKHETHSMEFAGQWGYNGTNVLPVLNGTLT
jgi:hypothetical protein